MTVNMWKQSVRSGGVLTVFQGQTFTGSTWVTELDPAMKTLNHLLDKHGFALRFDIQDAAAHANVVLETIPGNKLHGTDEIEIFGANTMGQATIKLPANPTVNQLKDGAPVGPRVKRHVLMHELIHGVGLDNGEHAESGVFIGRLILSAGAVVKGKLQSADGDDSVPDFVLAHSTILALQSAWPEKKKKS